MGSEPVMLRPAHSLAPPVQVVAISGRWGRQRVGTSCRIERDEGPLAAIVYDVVDVDRLPGSLPAGITTLAVDFGDDLPYEPVIVLATRALAVRAAEIGAGHLLVGGTFSPVDVASLTAALCADPPSEVRTTFVAPGETIEPRLDGTVTYWYDTLADPLAVAVPAEAPQRPAVDAARAIVASEGWEPAHCSGDAVIAAAAAGELTACQRLGRALRHHHLVVAQDRCHRLAGAAASTPPAAEVRGASG